MQIGTKISSLLASAVLQINILEAGRFGHISLFGFTVVEGK
jgi:hypothetical protein